MDRWGFEPGRPAGGGQAGGGNVVQSDLLYRGEWAAGTTYAASDVAAFDGVLYVASASIAGTTTAPSNDNTWTAQTPGTRCVMSWPAQAIDGIEELGASVIAVDVGQAGTWCHLREQVRLARSGKRLYPPMGGILAWLRIVYAFGDSDLRIYNDGGYLSYTGVAYSGDWTSVLGDATGATGGALSGRRFPCITMGAGTPFTIAVDYRWRL